MWYERVVQTRQDTEFVDLTGLAARIVEESGIRDGLCVVYVPHTTAGITINENTDPDVLRDLRSALDAMVPRGPFRHAEGNSPAHVRASLVGSSVTIPIAEGRLALGTWQGVFFCEFDGPRRRRVMIGCLGTRG